MNRTSSCSLTTQRNFTSDEKISGMFDALNEQRILVWIACVLQSDAVRTLACADPGALYRVFTMLSWAKQWWGWPCHLLYPVTALSTLGFG